MVSNRYIFMSYFYDLGVVNKYESENIELILGSRIEFLSFKEIRYLCNEAETKTLILEEVISPQYDFSEILYVFKNKAVRSYSTTSSTFRSSLEEYIYKDFTGTKVPLSEYVFDRSENRDILVISNTANYLKSLFPLAFAEEDNRLTCQVDACTLIYSKFLVMKFIGKFSCKRRLDVNSLLLTLKENGVNLRELDS